MSSSNPSSRPLIGVFGGTFDPVHQGHLACARYVLEHCALDQLQFMPCHMPPHRASPGVSAQQRATMVELAIADEPAMLLQPLELNRDWQRILELSHLIVCQRPGYSRMDGDAPALLKQYAAAPSALRQYTHGKIIELNNPNFSPSATAIREALAQNQQNISELAPSVLNYIQQHRLYQS